MTAMTRFTTKKDPNTYTTQQCIEEDTHVGQEIMSDNNNSSVAVA